MVIWTPQYKQSLFMERWEDEALYGGAAGGGKSDALVIEALRQVDIPNYKGLILRRTYPQLSELIDKSQQYYKPVWPEAKYNTQEHEWKFPSGAKVKFGSCQYEQNKYDYQGHQYDFIGFDELTHFTQSQYEYILTRNRASGTGTEVYSRSTANPGGVGHGWVKERFVSPAKPMTTLWETAAVRMPDGSTKEVERSRIYVPATIFDNQKLLDNNPAYLADLAMKPEAEREALLYGNWDSFEGQVFTEWINDPDHYEDHRYTHVIEPFRVPSYWRFYRGFDFGYAKPFSVGWYAADQDGCMYRIREWYGCKPNQPNTGIMIDPHEIAKGIREVEENDENLKGRQIRAIADPSIFDRSRGESVADQMMQERVYWEPGDNTRIAGKMQYHYRLAFDKNGKSMFYVFDTCKDFIRTIPSLVYDEKKVEDIDTTQEDHIYDECRYVLMADPIKQRKNEMKKDNYGEDPLDLRPGKGAKGWQM